MGRRVLATAAQLLYVIAIPVALVTASIMALVGDADFYTAGQARHAVGKTTEFGLETLCPINRAIVTYFRSTSLSLPDALAAEGADPAVFNDREVHHMDDVRGLIQSVDVVLKLSLALVVIYIVGGLILSGRSHMGALVPATLWGSGLTLGLLALFGLLATTDFSSLFLNFHLLSFDNDLWQLDPARDNLIRIFPFYFWYDATLQVVIRTVAIAVVLGIVSGGILIAGSRSEPRMWGSRA